MSHNVSTILFGQYLLVGQFYFLGVNFRNWQPSVKQDLRSHPQAWQEYALTKMPILRRTNVIMRLKHISDFYDCILISYIPSMKEIFHLEKDVLTNICILGHAYQKHCLPASTKVTKIVLKYSFILFFKVISSPFNAHLYALKPILNIAKFHFTIELVVHLKIFLF